MSEHCSVNKVYRVSWSQTDTETGLGPYGSSLHITRTNAKEFFDAMAKADPWIEADSNPYKDTLQMIDVHSEVYMALIEKDGSMWEPVKVGR